MALFSFGFRVVCSCLISINHPVRHRFKMILSILVPVPNRPFWSASFGKGLLFLGLWTFFYGVSRSDKVVAIRVVD